MEMETEQVTAFGKSPQTVNAPSLLCFWAHRKLGMTTLEIGKRLNISQSAVSLIHEGATNSKRESI
jgi:REP-associated tyrosine transposase